MILWLLWFWIFLKPVIKPWVTSIPKQLLTDWWLGGRFPRFHGCLEHVGVLLLWIVHSQCHQWYFGSSKIIKPWIWGQKLFFLPLFTSDAAVMFLSIYLRFDTNCVVVCLYSNEMLINKWSWSPFPMIMCWNVANLLYGCLLLLSGCLFCASAWAVVQATKHSPILVVGS